jgi:hypothetical protein
MTDLALPEHSRPTWREALDRMERSLRQTLALIVEPSTASVEPEAACAAALQVLDDRLTSWQACLDQAAGDTESAAALGMTEELALAGLIPRIQQTREKLAKWTRPVA